MEVPNRIVMPPMTTRLADDQGHVTEALVAYYRARALGGVGLVTVEMGSPERAGRHRFHELGVYDDRFLPGLERLTTVLHDAGARVSVQLGHGGSRARNAVSDETPIAPSSIPTPVYEVEAETVVPSEMSEARIEQTTQAFVEAARRAQMAGFELDFTDSVPPQNEKICVVGAGPAGLSYARLVADHNSVTVVERAPVSGGAFRFTGKAPVFGEGEASEESFVDYVAELELACREKGVGFRHGVDVTEEPRILEGYDRVVFATGARYRYGLGGLATRLLDSGFGKSKVGRRLFASERLRNWLYYGARRDTGPAMRRLADQKVVVIGDAASPGKARDAIDGAFRAALLAE